MCSIGKCTLCCTARSNEGRWFHVKLRLAAPATYECAVDVDSKKSDVGVRWRVLTVDPAAFAPASAFAPGYHALASTSTNGIWQDGGVMTERPDGRLDAFISRFSSQADRTDQNGHPL